MSIISEYMIKQMQHEMEIDDEKTYFIAMEGTKLFSEPFEQLSSEQKFYINKNNKLVIAFDKYEVTPGYMGNVTFEIPTELIEDYLIGNYYIN